MTEPRGYRDCLQTIRDLRWSLDTGLWVYDLACRHTVQSPKKPARSKRAFCPKCWKRDQRIERAVEGSAA